MVDFHSHTTLCGHAAGTPEEYLENAIKRGVTVFGFSDHAPLPEHLRKGVSMAPDETEDYIEMIEAAKEQFADKIDVKIGFELDYPWRDSFDSRYLSDPRIDFIIGSVHYLEDWPVDHSDYLDGYEKRGVDNVYKRYYTLLGELAASGKVDIIGHFDLVKKYGYRPNENMEPYIREVAKKAIASETTIELNTAGLRKPVKEIYPSMDIIEILADEGVLFTLGSDSHTPEDAGKDLDIAVQMLRKVGVTKVQAFSKRKRFEVEI